jgi:peptidoglycan/xylan/chitin deacetylase (PgdA/CDA1 family)
MRSLWLMYHDVYKGAPVAGVPASADLYHVSAEAFTSHLDVIERSGLRVLSAGEFLRAPAASADNVVMTFDDGWNGTFEVALPLLHERGWTATAFVTRDFVGRRGFSSASTLRDAAAAGMEIGIHGATHRMLSACSHDEVVEEFRGCKDYLEGLLGQPVDHASIPGGDRTATVVACAREAMVKSLSNSRPGVNEATTSHFDLRRVAMKKSTTTEDLQRFCRFDLARERSRWALLQLPRTMLGMKRYTKLRRMVMHANDHGGFEVFKP